MALTQETRVRVPVSEFFPRRSFWRERCEPSAHRALQIVSSYSSVGQSVRLITVRSAVQARVGAFCPHAPIKKKRIVEDTKSVRATPVGFEPTRAEHTGLAGRRLNHSAKVSLLQDTACSLAPAMIPEATMRALPNGLVGVRTRGLLHAKQT